MAWVDVSCRAAAPFSAVPSVSVCAQSCCRVVPFSSASRSVRCRSRRVSSRVGATLPGRQSVSRHPQHAHAPDAEATWASPTPAYAAWMRHAACRARRPRSRRASSAEDSPSRCSATGACLVSQKRARPRRLAVVCGLPTWRGVPGRMLRWTLRLPRPHRSHLMRSVRCSMCPARSRSDSDAGMP